MSYATLANQFSQCDGVEQSTMMGSPCLRYRGDFVAMMFDREESLIIKVSAQRVDDLIARGQGNEFNFTKKRFKEWVLIPLEFEPLFEAYIEEAIEYAKIKQQS